MCLQSSLFQQQDIGAKKTWTQCNEEGKQTSTKEPVWNSQFQIRPDSTIHLAHLEGAISAKSVYAWKDHPTSTFLQKVLQAPVRRKGSDSSEPHQNLARAAQRNVAVKTSRPISRMACSSPPEALHGVGPGQPHFSKTFRDNRLVSTAVLPSVECKCPAAHGVGPGKHFSRQGVRRELTPNHENKVKDQNWSEIFIFRRQLHLRFEGLKVEVPVGTSLKLLACLPPN